MNPAHYPLRLPLRRMTLAAIAVTLVAGVGAATPKPNIVFIFADDHAIQTIGAYGARLSAFSKQHGITPNIDQLAEKGGVFLNSFCGNSLCSTSRASIITGLHSHANGVRTLNKSINAGLWTFPRSARDEGYATDIGKWHLATTVPEFEYWRILPGQGSYLNPTFIGPAGEERHKGYATDIITDLSLGWLKQRDRSKLFFLWQKHPDVVKRLSAN